MTKISMVLEAGKSKIRDQSADQNQSLVTAQLWLEMDAQLLPVHHQEESRGRGEHAFFFSSATQ